MTKRAVYLFLLGVLCVSTALAGTKRQVISKLDGKTAGGNLFVNLTGGLYVHLFFSPEQLPDGSWGYYTDITWNDGTGHEIYGDVLLSAISSAGLSGPVQMNITVDSFYATGEDPSGTGVSDFTSLVGTFTPYTGGTSYSAGSSGKNYNTLTHDDGSQETITFQGASRGEAATFEGTLNVTGGPYDLSVQGPAGNIFVQVGNQTDVITTP